MKTYIQKSTHMPSIGLVALEIVLKSLGKYFQIITFVHWSRNQLKTFMNEWLDMFYHLGVLTLKI